MLRASQERIDAGMYWDRGLSWVEGCSPVSEGCRGCWAAEAAALRACQGNPKMKTRYGGLVVPGSVPPTFNGTVRFMKNDLDKPPKVKKPTVWAVWNDLFHPEAVPYAGAALRVMCRAPQHTFLVLTKRPRIMRDFLGSCLHQGIIPSIPPWIYLGFTAENQARFDERWAYMKDIPASVVWVSHGPALGRIDYPSDFLARGQGAWVVTEGESGRHARPMHPDIPRLDRDQCQDAGVPFFFKQWGEWAWAPRFAVGENTRLRICRGGKVEPVDFTKKTLPEGGFLMFGTEYVIGRIGKKAAGRELDGRLWSEFPQQPKSPRGSGASTGTVPGSSDNGLKCGR